MYYFPSRSRQISTSYSTPPPSCSFALDAFVIRAVWEDVIYPSYYSPDSKFDEIEKYEVRAAQLASILCFKASRLRNGVAGTNVFSDGSLTSHCPISEKGLMHAKFHRMFFCGSSIVIMIDSRELKRRRSMLLFHAAEILKQRSSIRHIDRPDHRTIQLKTRTSALTIIQQVYPKLLSPVGPPTRLHLQQLLAPSR